MRKYGLMIDEVAALKEADDFRRYRWGYVDEKRVQHREIKAAIECLRAGKAKLKRVRARRGR